VEIHSPTSIKHSIIWPLLASFIILVIIFFSAIYIMEVNRAQKESKLTVDHVEQDFLNKMDETAQLLSSQIYAIESSQCVQSALTKWHINDLKNCTKNFFNILEDMFLVTEINYYTNDKKYVLSINGSEDTIKKQQLLTKDFVITRAINTGELSYGLEITEDKKLMLITSRILVSNAKNPVYIEIKLDMDLMLVTLESLEQVSILILAEKNEQELIKAQKENQHRFDFSQLKEHIVIYDGELISQNNELLQEFASPSFFNRANHFVLNEEYYIFGYFPMLNQGGRYIGHFIVLKNNTDSVQALKVLLLQLIIVIGTLTLIWFITFYRYLNRIDSRLKEYYSALIAEIEERKIVQKKIKVQDELIMAQSRHAAMGEMISMIAHQWRQPISVIAMEANNMLADIEFDEIETESFSRDAKNIIAQTQHLSKTIDDFRNFFRPEKKKEWAIPQKIMEECFSIVGKSLENHNIELKKNYQSQQALLLYSRELLQVIINIIKNAKEALLAHHKQEGKLLVDISEVNDMLQIAIIDNAGGIEENIQNKIFEPYFTTKDKHSGTGLGLYMSKIIIEEHMGGKLEINNTIDGAKFTILLPLK